MTRLQNGMKCVVSFMTAIVCCGMLSAEDGEWLGGASVNWQDAANWKDEKIAGGEHAAAYMRTSADFTFSEDVVLHSLHKLDGVSDSSFSRAPGHADIAFLLKNNPLVYSVPPCSVGVEIYFKGNNIIKGDGSVLTFEGSSYNFASGTAGKYAISGYDLVVAKDVISFSPRSRGGLVDGDLKLVNSRLNANLAENTTAVTNAPISGKLIIGSGLNYFRMGYLSTMMLPAVIEREPKGVFCTFETGNLHGLRTANAVDFVNAEGRFPTWFLYGSGSAFDFLAYDETEGATGGFKPALIPGANVLSAGTTDKQTVLINNAAGTTSMGGDVKAAAVKVQTLLNLDDGATLTLGNDREPGLLMLNSHVRGFGGGLKFDGQPDGVIVANGGDKHLESRLTGAKSVTVVAGYDSAYRALHLDNPQNDFSGGLDVLIGIVAVTNGGALGTGPVRVHGFPGNFDWDFTTADSKKGLTGGAGVLQVNDATVTNDLILAGIGPIVQGDNFGRPLCALQLGNGSRVEGPITLDNGAAIRSDAGFAEIAGPVSGAHKLYLWPYTDGILRLSGTFDMDGNPIEITSPKNGNNYMGTVQLASTASFGSSDVRNDAMLVFESERTVDNALTGWGTYFQTNDFNTVFTKRFEQGGVYADKGTITFQAATNTVGSLVGEGVVELTATEAQLTVGSTESGYDGYFNGTLKTPPDGTLTLVKQGDSTQILAAPLSFTGDVVVEGGTLRLGGIGDSLPQTITKPQFHMDATDVSTVMTNENGKVREWVNKGTATGDNFLQADEGRMPTYSADAMGGRGGLVFNGTRAIATDGNGNPTYGGPLREGEEVRTNRLCLARATANVRSLYMAYLVKDAHSFAGPIGEKDKDSGIRWSDDSGSSSFNFDLGFAKGKWGIESNMFWLNGKNTGSAKLNETLVMSAVLASTGAKCLSIGQYIATFPPRVDYNYPRAMNGDVGELLVYSNPLKVHEDYMVSKHLFNKWGVAEDAAAENVLPVTATLTVREGATVDFAGVNQTLERIDNDGILMNSSADEVVLTVKSGTLGGTIKGNIRIVKQGEGTLVLDNAFIDSWTGGISVQAGTLALKTWRATEVPVKDGLSFHLDASDLSSLEFADGGSRVATWKDLSGNKFDFKEDSAIVSASPLGLQPPKFDGSLYDGRGGLVFEANGTDYDGANRLSSGANKCVVRTIFFMTQVDGCVRKEDGGGSFSGLFGERDNDWGIRLNSETSYAPYRTVKEGNTTEKGFGVSEYYFVDGVNTTGFAKGKRHVFQASTNGDGWNTAWALGQYTTFHAGGGGRRGYIGSIGEVIAYDRLITGVEQTAVTAYLREKWIDGVKASMELNENATIEVAEGATLDLGGTTQAVNGLSGSGGIIKNGNVTVSGVLEVTADANGVVNPYVFDGVEFEDGLRIVIKGTPGTSRFVIAKGVKRANTSTFILPSSVWKATFGNGELSLSRGGTLLILR